MSKRWWGYPRIQLIDWVGMIMTCMQYCCQVSLRQRVFLSIALLVDDDQPMGLVGTIGSMGYSDGERCAGLMRS